MDKNVSSPLSVSAKYLIYGLLLFTPLARGSVKYWHLTVIELVTLAIVFVLLLEKVLVGKPAAWRKTRLDKPVIGMLLLCLVSLVCSQAKNDSVEAFLLILTYATLFFCIIHSFRTRNDELELVYVICGIGGLLTLIAFLKYAGITLSFWVYEELHYPDAFLSGTYGNHNHLAGYLEMVIPFILVLFFTRSRNWPVKIVLSFTAVFVMAGHILTLSRGGWISLGLALVFMAVVLMFHKRFRSKKILILLSAFFVIVLLIILSGSDLFLRALTVTDDEVVMGMGGRMIAWKGTLAMLKDFLVIGSGPGTFATVFPQYQPAGTTTRFYQVHNDYLQYLVELGVVFVPMCCWMLYSLFSVGRKKMRSTSRQTWGVALGAMTGIVAILVHSAVDFNLHIPANAILFIVLAAMIVGGPVRRSGNGQSKIS